MRYDGRAMSGGQRAPGHVLYQQQQQPTYVTARRNTSGNRPPMGQSSGWQQSPVHASRSMSPPPDALSEWQLATQNDLQNLLPNANVRVAPNCHYNGQQSQQQRTTGAPTGWPPQSRIPFNQPPPMLHMGGVGVGSPMRPSPPMPPDFAHPPPMPPHLGMTDSSRMQQFGA